MFRSLLPPRRGELARGQDGFLSLQREMHHLLDDMWRGAPSVASNGTYLVPLLDVKETEKSVEVTAELPGVDEKDVQVMFEDGVLTVRGEKKTEKEETEAGYHVAERSYGAFYRAVDIVSAIEADKVAANFAKGVLKITLPKAAGVKAPARKIEIKSAA